METVRINGVDVPIDSIEGPTSLELNAAYRRQRQTRAQTAPSAMQGSGSKYVGTPRLQKHRGDCGAYGVRIK